MISPLRGKEEKVTIRIILEQLVTEEVLDKEIL